MVQCSPGHNPVRDTVQSGSPGHRPVQSRTPSSPVQDTVQSSPGHHSVQSRTPSSPVRDTVQSGSPGHRPVQSGTPSYTVQHAVQHSRHPAQTSQCFAQQTIAVEWRRSVHDYCSHNACSLGAPLVRGEVDGGGGGGVGWGRHLH